jgi:hypothetical protein
MCQGEKMEITAAIEHWIDTTNTQYAEKRKSCTRWSQLNEYYPESTLNRAGFVVIDQLPFPGSTLIANCGLNAVSPLSLQKVGAITYGETYYVRPQYCDDIEIHFHELVHIAQYQYLGICGFLKLYLHQIINYGYHNAPLEIMAYALQKRFREEQDPFDVPTKVAQQLYNLTGLRNSQTL